MKSFFPDVNVWVALSWQGHQHHVPANHWFDGLRREQAYFCRHTQLSFLRLISNPAIMGVEVRNQDEAWATYNRMLEDERVSFHLEPDIEQLDEAFQALTRGPAASWKIWTDAYLAAFAQTADLLLVTFDRGLHQISGHHALLLR